MRITAGEISTRPIAGTRPRAGDAEQDRRDTAELVAHPKERAEHIMLIDLERNDLGRVCEAGSVRVDEYMVTESYAHVHHIVSNVRGRLRADRSPVDALRALFPGGTITGCPKVRCMQIIAALEGRGAGRLHRFARLVRHRRRRGLQHPDPHADVTGRMSSCAPAGASSRTPYRSGSSRRLAPRHAACCAPLS